MDAAARAAGVEEIEPAGVNSRRRGVQGFERSGPRVEGRRQRAEGRHRGGDRLGAAVGVEGCRRRGRGRGAEPEGFRCPLFEYTGKTVVGLAKYNQLREAELRRVLPMAGQWKGPGYGYKEKWPDDWSQKLDEKIQGSGHTIPVTMMMTHVYEETKKAFSAGGFKNYERAHLEALTRTVSPKLALPPELVRTVVELYLHAGFYPFTPAA